MGTVVAGIQPAIGVIVPAGSGSEDDIDVLGFGERRLRRRVIFYQVLDQLLVGERRAMQRHELRGQVAALPKGQKGEERVGVGSRVMQLQSRHHRMEHQLVGQILDRSVQQRSKRLDRM